MARASAVPLHTIRSASKHQLIRKIPQPKERSMEILLFLLLVFVVFLVAGWGWRAAHRR